MCVKLFKWSTHICPRYYTWAGVLLVLLYLLSRGIAFDVRIEYVEFILERCRHYLCTVFFSVVWDCSVQPTCSWCWSSGTLTPFCPCFVSECVPGLRALLQISWVVSLGPCFKFASNFSGLLIQEWRYNTPQYDVRNTFADIANDPVRVCLCWCPETHITPFY